MSQPVRVQLPDHATDLGVVRDYSLQLKIACDDLHDDPFDPEARARVVALLLEENAPADAALSRLQESIKDHTP